MILRAVGISQHPKSLALCTCHLLSAQSSTDEQSSTKARGRDSVFEADDKLRYKTFGVCVQTHMFIYTHRQCHLNAHFHFYIHTHWSTVCLYAGTVPACAIRSHKACLSLDLNNRTRLMWGEEFLLPGHQSYIHTDVEFDKMKLSTTLKYSFKRHPVGMCLKMQRKQFLRKPKSSHKPEVFQIWLGIKS